MLMPIVSMNKMAMNESVAATCCYHEKASPTNVYWEVLHGGWIGSGYVEMKTNDLFLADTRGWTDLTRDIKGWTSGSLPSLSKGLDGEWRVNLGVGGGINDFATVTDSKGNDNDWERLDTWLRAKGLSMKDATCAHSDTSCVYFMAGVEHKSNYHFESKSKHSVPQSGQTWTEPHAAGQFTS